MLCQNAILKNKTGLHARPAALFVQASKGFDSKITVYCNGRKADAKSILSVLTLGANLDSEITLEIEGEDEERALKTLLQMIENKFGEE